MIKAKDKQDQEEAAEEKTKTTFKVVSYMDYIKEARELLAKGPVNGMDDIWNVCISLLYANNEVVGIVHKAGETRFVVKA